jgi:hypothetical protein
MYQVLRDLLFIRYRVFFLRLNPKGHNMDHLPSSSGKFKNEWSYIYTPVAFSDMEMDKFTLIKYGISFPQLVD